MASIRDVAIKAGVGIGTVSRALNGSGYISDETKGGTNKTKVTKTQEAVWRVSLKKRETPQTATFFVLKV